jgi:hypothetical protein
VSSVITTLDLSRLHVIHAVDERGPWVGLTVDGESWVVLRPDGERREAYLRVQRLIAVLARVGRELAG